MWRLVLLFLVTSMTAQSIAPSRQTEIQRALNTHGYRGEMSVALKQVAKDHGWQTRSVPDSRVLILLGLGPKYPHLLNPETAWVASPVVVLAKR